MLPVVKEAENSIILNKAPNGSATLGSILVHHLWLGLVAAGQARSHAYGRSSRAHMLGVADERKQVSPRYIRWYFHVFKSVQRLTRTGCYGMKT